MARVQTREQTGRLQECDMPHSPSGSLCWLDSEFSMSAEALENGGSGGLFKKKTQNKPKRNNNRTCRHSARRQLSPGFRPNTYLLLFRYSSHVLTFTLRGGRRGRGFVICSALEAINIQSAPAGGEGEVMEV